MKKDNVFFKRYLTSFVYYSSFGCLWASIDVEGDGLDDVWQLYYDAIGLSAEADLDADGFSNLSESIAGTDPRDARSKPTLDITEVDGGEVQISMPTIEGKMYGVQTSDSLSHWQNTSISFIGVGTMQNMSLPTSELKQFYRIQITDVDSDSDGVSDYSETLLGFDTNDPTSNISGNLGGDLTKVISLLSSEDAFVLNDKEVSGFGVSSEQVSRFLTHATHGADLELISQVESVGYSSWLDTQFNISADSLIPTTIEYLNVQGSPYYRPMLSSWWKSNMTSEAILRQRVANAFAEIFVVSEAGVFDFIPRAQFHDVLLDGSFGNFRDLLSAISLQPAMGIYLSHLGNAKANAETGNFPDENFAREVMQLFSIGLFELNLDGSYRLDSFGEEIPTYTIEEIKSFARVFTGVGMAGNSFYTDANSENFQLPMQMYNTEHDTEAKTLLTYFGAPNGGELPSFESDPGRHASDDFEDAIDNLFNHPNVGPFIGYRLIQRLVKSNPSPEYIERVSMAFNDNGQGVRGDLKAVIRAVLLDKEARSLSPQSPFGGRLREPYFRKMQLAKVLGHTVSTGEYDFTDFNDGVTFGQRFYNSPSVFNFFLPSYQPKGAIEDAGMVAPEFQIHNDSTLLSMQNTLDVYMMYGSLENTIAPSRKVYFNLDDEEALADNAVLLVDHLNLVFAAGQLSERTRSIIVQAVNSIPSSDRPGRLRMAMRLIQISPDYSVVQ